MHINEIKNNIKLVNIDEENKSIKYNCNDYRIIDLCDDKFHIMQYKRKYIIKENILKNNC
ncbi:hypothetical protein ACXAT3_002668 [Clostridium sporogenes]